MSWSFSVVGRPKAVAAACRAEAEKSPCAEPEESIRKTTLELAALSAENHTDDNVVKVEASGSMYSQDGACHQNQVSLSVRTIYNFVE